MARKTNVTKNGYDYFRIKRKVGTRINSRGEVVPHYREFYGKSKAEAEAKYQAYIRQGTSARSSLYESVESYIKNFLLPDSRIKDSTKERYISAWRNNIPDQPIALKELNDITGLELQAVYNGLTCGPSTVRSIHKLLSRFYKYALSEGLTDRDITANVSLPKVQKKQPDAIVETWTEEELQTIITESEGHRLHFLLVMAAGTGLRISELLALRYEDIAEDSVKVQRQVYRDPVFDENGNKTGYVQKIRELKTGSSRRSVPLNNDVLLELEKHRQQQRAEMLEHGYRTDNIFTTSTGSLYFNGSIQKALKRLYDRIGVPYRNFHCYRHTFASRLAAAGVPIQTVSRLLGHGDVSTTGKYYIDVDDTEKVEAVRKLQLFTNNV